MIFLKSLYCVIVENSFWQITLFILLNRFTNNLDARCAHGLSQLCNLHNLLPLAKGVMKYKLLHIEFGQDWPSRS